MAIFDLNSVSHFSNIADHKPSDVIFDLGSVTKILATTSIVMKLVETGQLDLDSLVSRYLPFQQFGSFTVRDLLEHRAGLWEWWPLYAILDDPQEVLPFLAKKELRYEPDSQWRYSDLGFILLGEVLKSISQTPLNELFNEMVATPLNLRATQYAHPANLEKTVPSSYGDRAEHTMLTTNSPYPVDIPPKTFSKWRSHVLHGEINDGNAFHLFGGISSHAGLFASIVDLVTYGRSLLNNDYFTNLELFTRSGREENQALGFRRFGKKWQAFGHTGYPGIALVINPLIGKGFAFGTNRLLVEGTPVPTTTFIPPLLDLLETVVI